MVNVADATQQATAANYLNSVDSSGNGLFWIGLTDLSQEGNYVWEDGTSATYFNWYLGEPNDPDGSSDCVHMDYHSKDRRWTDSGCFSLNIQAFCQTSVKKGKSNCLLISLLFSFS